MGTCRGCSRIRLRHGGDAAEDFLHEIGRVGILQAAAHAIGMDQRRVELHEIVPGNPIGRIADFEEESRAGD
jgi:hypothetical protein